MKVSLHLGDKDHEYDFKGRLSRWLRWIVVGLVLWAATTAASIYVVVRLDPLSLVDLVDLEIKLDQGLKVKFNSRIPVTARVDQVLTVPVRDKVDAMVDVDQEFIIPIDEEFTAPFDFTVMVPVDQEVRVAAEVPLRMVIPVDTVLTVTLPVLGTVNAPVKGRIPVDVIVPMEQKAWVKAEVPVRFQRDVTFHVKKNVRVPLKARIKGDIRIDTALTLPIHQNILANVLIQDVIEGQVVDNLVLNRRTLSLRSDSRRVEEMKDSILDQLLPDGVRARVLER